MMVKVGGMMINDGWEMILLMLQKSHSQPPGMVLKPVVNNVIFTIISTGAGFLPSTVVSYIIFG